MLYFYYLFLPRRKAGCFGTIVSGQPFLRRGAFGPIVVMVGGLLGAFVGLNAVGNKNAPT